MSIIFIALQIRAAFFILGNKNYFFLFDRTEENYHFHYTIK